jgi:ribonucleoside-diphosphate reductase alpha chain
MTTGHAASRKKLPPERPALTHKFNVAGHEGYLTVGLYPSTEGAPKPGEIFLRMSKEGSTVSGLVDPIAVLTSICLQYGVPIEVLVAKFKHTRFQPAGTTHHPDIPEARSILDYIFRYLELRYCAEPVEADDPSLTALTQKQPSEITAAKDPTGGDDE